MGALTYTVDPYGTDRAVIHTQLAPFRARTVLKIDLLFSRFKKFVMRLGTGNSLRTADEGQTGPLVPRTICPS